MNIKNIAAVFVAVLLLGGCGQDVNFTVYNTSGITPYQEQYLGATATWEKGSEANAFSASSTGRGLGPTQLNSSFKTLKTFASSSRPERASKRPVLLIKRGSLRILKTGPSAWFNLEYFFCS